jgi:hypothetical protein
MFGIGLPELVILGILTTILFSRRIGELRQNLEQFCPESRRGYHSALDKPRFTLKDLLATTALIALGLAWIVFALPTLRRSLDNLELPVWAFIVGGAFLGAAILTPFRRAHIGAIWGALVQLALIQSARSFGWPHF